MFGTTSTSVNKKIFGFLVGLALASQVNAHLFIKYPAPPMEGPRKEPLDPSGSDFPCHGATIQTSGGIGMAAGSSQLLQFDDGNGANTAVHGGGSCQLSVYYGGDDPAEKKEKNNWHVIHSIEGGCPTNAPGNLATALQCGPDDDGTDCLKSYNFTMPKGLANGHATFAWTWYNTIGNRELYMNCVNAQITGGDGSEMGSFPSLFVANLAGGTFPQCATSEQQSYKFPFPGKYVTSDTKGSPYKLSLVSGGSCASDGAPAGGSGPGGSAPGGGAAPSYGATTPKPSGNSHGSGKPPAGQVTVTTMKTMTTSGSAAPTSAPAPPGSSAVPSSAANPSSAAAPAPYTSESGSSSSGSGSCPSGAQPCSNNGEVLCMGMKFGLCNNGCAIPQPLAAGTTCTNGKIAKRDHVRRHIGRTHVRQFA